MKIRSRSVTSVVGVCLGLVGLLQGTPAWAAFGVVKNGANYSVDSGAGLLFWVDGANGDITSIKLNGTELNSPVKRSHIGSGLGSATVTTATYGTSTVKITVSTSTLTHYYMVRNGQNTIYMATYISEQPTVGELRWITRLQTGTVPNSPAPSDLRGTTGAIESQDVFGLTNGQTRSKYYGNERAMDLAVRGVTGNGIGVWMNYGNRESASGGPFFRDIQNQTGDQQEVYNYMNSGHNQTEPFRTGVLHGPYALIFTNGSTPQSWIDTSWIYSQGLNLTGWVQHRGYVNGKANGIPAGFQGVVAFSSATSQGWCVVDPATGNFSGPWLKPGNYTMTLYKGELAVASQPVTIPQSTVPVTKNITSAEFVPASSLWRIGEWDGTPAGFKNAANIKWMHPSDSRQTPWGPTTFTIGSSAPGGFPSIQWKDVNNSTAIKFDVSSNQLAPLTLRVGITGAYAGGRPQIKVNNWTSPAPAASSQPNSRSFTIGTYRGNNATYTYNIPMSALVVGTNTLNLTVISGSSGTGFLSPSVAYDCIELSAS
jgi:rhamnogalacturonan endolyase